MSNDLDQIKFVTSDQKEQMKKKIMKEKKLGPSSPLKDRTCDRDKIIPFKHLNKKIYFKTIENIVQNSNNKTYNRFHQAIEERERRNRNAKAWAKAVREGGEGKQMGRQHLDLQQTTTSMDSKDAKLPASSGTAPHDERTASLMGQQLKEMEQRSVENGPEHKVADKDTGGAGTVEPLP